METSRKLFIPVVLGTARMGRMSLHPARLVTEELSKRNGVETDLIDIAKLPLPTNDAGEAIKNAEFSTKMYRADALVIVSPEYNHGYSGLLKHVLDSCLKEYIHKDVNFSSVQKTFSTEGELLEESYILRIDKFLKELIWMAKTLRHVVSRYLWSD
jgi:multimeric flavodoxin WrbA